MSIRLPELLELSHDLCHARKRRSEWEFLHDECLRNLPKVARRSPCPEPAAETRARGSNCADLIDDAESGFLRAAIEERGFSPREPLAELVFLQLLRAHGPRAPATRTRGGEGTDFEWMCVDDEEVVQLHGAAPAHQKTVDRVEEVGSAQEEVLKRLSELLHAGTPPPSPACPADEDEEHAEALALREEMTHAAMIEAEHEELSLLLAEHEGTSSEAAVPTSPDPSSEADVCKTTPCMAPADSGSMSGTPLMAKGSNQPLTFALSLAPSLAI